MPKSQAELAAKLDHLDPGGSLRIEAEKLEQIFGSHRPIESMIQAAERFAEEHRCTFSYHGHDPAVSEFTKDDVF